MRLHQFELFRLATICSSFVVMAMLSVFVTTASAQTPSAAAEAPMEEVVVIGSRRRDRSVGDSPVPVDIIGGDELATQGSSEMEEP